MAQPAILFFAVPVVIGCGSLLMTIHMVQDTSKALRTRDAWTPAEGTVIDAWHVRSTKTWGHEVTFDLWGRQIVATTASYVCARRRIGSTISIRYDPDQPEHIVLGSLWCYLPMMLGVAIGAALTLITFGVIAVLLSVILGGR